MKPVYPTTKPIVVPWSKKIGVHDQRKLSEEKLERQTLAHVLNCWKGNIALNNRYYNDEVLTVIKVSLHDHEGLDKDNTILADLGPEQSYLLPLNSDYILLTSESGQQTL